MFNIQDFLNIEEYLILSSRFNQNSLNLKAFKT